MRLGSTEPKLTGQGRRTHIQLFVFAHVFGVRSSHGGLCKVEKAYDFMSRGVPILRFFHADVEEGKVRVLNSVWKPGFINGLPQLSGFRGITGDYGRSREGNVTLV